MPRTSVASPAARSTQYHHGRGSPPRCRHLRRIRRRGAHSYSRSSIDDDGERGGGEGGDDDGDVAIVDAHRPVMRDDHREYHHDENTAPKTTGTSSPLPSPANIVDDDGTFDDTTMFGWMDDASVNDYDDVPTSPSGGTSMSSREASWARRHARSIDEGVRFKSLLREGLESRIGERVRRERLLSDLLSGAGVGGCGSAATTTTATTRNSDNDDNDNNNTNARWKFLSRWSGMFGGGRGSHHDRGYGTDRADDDVVVDTVTDDSTAAIPNADSLTTTTSTKMKANSSVDMTNDDGGINNGNNVNNRNNFGARFISGLIVALAEEVRDLEVEVDADPSTPMWDKRVDSMRVYFSRLGFRQLRMGGIDGESRMSSVSGMFGSNDHGGGVGVGGGFFGFGKSDTADEAFDKIDVDKSGSLDVWELAQALKMAALIGGAKFGARSRETWTELASRLVGLYDTNGDGVVDRQEYQEMVQDMAALRYARMREEGNTDGSDTGEEDTNDNPDGRTRRGWFSSIFGDKVDEASSSSSTVGMPTGNDAAGVTDTEEIRDSVDQGEGSLVLEGLQVDLRRLFFGAIPGVKRVRDSFCPERCVLGVFHPLSYPIFCKLCYRT